MNKTPLAALAALATLSLFAASSAFAKTSDELVKNGSFEKFSKVSKNDAWGQTSNVNGWTSLVTIAGVDADVLEIQKVNGQSGFIQTSYDGDHYLELNANRLGAISQTLKTTSGQTYTLTFGYADRPDAGLASSMDVYWGDQKIKSFSVLSSTGTSTATSISANPGSGWTTYSATVTADSAQTALSFYSTGPTNKVSYGSYLDGVSVTAVPEPASYAMLLAGLGVMATVARRRSKATQA